MFHCVLLRPSNEYTCTCSVICDMLEAVTVTTHAYITVHQFVYVTTSVLGNTLVRSYHTQETKYQSYSSQMSIWVVHPAPVRGLHATFFFKICMTIMASNIFTPDIRVSRFDINVFELISEFLELILSVSTKQYQVCICDTICKKGP